MNMIALELRKEKRTWIAAVLPAVGILGALYAFLNFSVRKETLLALPLPPMDILLTQVYGMILVLNMFGILVAATMMYYMEFHGSAMKKLYMLPIRIEGIFLSKAVILLAMLMLTLLMEFGALAVIGLRDLPSGTFHAGILLRFSLYSYVTTLPVLSFLLLIASRIENLYCTLGIGVLGFLSGMALANSSSLISLLHPFALMLKPAMAMSATPDQSVLIAGLIESFILFFVGLLFTKKRHYE
ncbi:MAG: ABC transporter permease [Peptoniphilaceae bacterium]|nr:ABC transporter permease [Peptoniphilaceae bacterium]MDD7433992.1 ABC transporter permease [Peptoniphilaceae bacterium]MDY3075606.1 ABC transporter permease [Peptoniphilaceae bacterium]MDY4196464.1 ABC transporter permease [Peptoniphilaceae bacterium]